MITESMFAVIQKDLQSLTDSVGKHIGNIYAGITGMTKAIEGLLARVEELEKHAQVTTLPNKERGKDTGIEL